MSRFSWTTSGESHGPSMAAVVQGVPAGLPLDLEAIDADLARRQEGYGRGGRMKIETDRVEVLSGLKGGVTLGSPLTLLVRNKDSVIEKLPQVAAPRPGHADLAGCMKYGHRDGRAVLERASARETAPRVAALRARNRSPPSCWRSSVTVGRRLTASSAPPRRAWSRSSPTRP